jgi:ATP-dependent DNA helicase RecG
MLELELQKYLRREYPQENARCEWKEYKNLKNSFCGNEKNDVISYVLSPTWRENNNFAMSADY